MEEKIRELIRRHSEKRSMKKSAAAEANRVRAGRIAAALSESGHSGTMLWKGKEFSFTTGQFAKLDKFYRRHCGPTAVLNLVCTLAKSEGRPVTEKPEAAFRRIARIGGRRFIYLNADFMKLFGGTSDILAPVFIRSALSAYGLDRYKVRGPFPATGKRICSELDKGAILYLEVHRHPVYGNHHMLCYGYRIDDGKLLLRVADGWITRIHDLPAGEELFSFCTAVAHK